MHCAPQRHAVAQQRYSTAGGTGGRAQTNIWLVRRMGALPLLLASCRLDSPGRHDSLLDEATAWPGCAACCMVAICCPPSSGALALSTGVSVIKGEVGVPQRPAQRPGLDLRDLWSPARGAWHAGERPKHSGMLRMRGKCSEFDGLMAGGFAPHAPHLRTRVMWGHGRRCPIRWLAGSLRHSYCTGGCCRVVPAG